MEDKHLEYLLEHDYLKFIQENEQGFKFYLNKYLTEWATRPLNGGTDLNFKIITVVKDDKIQGHLGYYNDKIYDIPNTTLEDVCLKIDLIKTFTEEDE
jgi:hypothetical protein